MTTMLLDVFPEAWEITTRKTPKGIIEIHTSRTPIKKEVNGKLEKVGEWKLFINTKAGTIWIPKHRQFQFDKTADELRINGIDFGYPDKITKNGTARWKPKNKRLAEIVTQVTPPPYPKKSKSNIKEIEYSEILHKAKSKPSTWNTDNLWKSRIEVEGVPSEKKLLIQINRAESFDDVYRGWKDVVFGIDGTTRYYEIESPYAVDSFKIKIRFQIDQDDPYQFSKHQELQIKRPETPRPATKDWWEKRAVRLPVETLSKDFDETHLDFVECKEYTADVPHDCHYQGSTPINVRTISTPGGFGVCWDWKDGETPVPKDWDRINWFSDPIRPCGVRIWYRNTRLRGTGAVWRASVDARHLNPQANNIITIPVNRKSAKPGDLVDVMVQGTTLRTNALPPAKIQTVIVGDYPKCLNPGLMVSMTVSAFREFPGVEPITIEDYDLLKSRISESKQFKSSIETDTQETEIGLKMQIIETGKVLTDDDMRHICKLALPEFSFNSDRMGYFNALPEELWQEVIEQTDTDTLNYDYVWTTCADFAGDFKSAAGRLGAKALIIWDNAGGHAYNILPVLNDDDSVSLKYFEPQNDGFPKIDKLSGQYRQTNGGTIYAW